MNIKRKLVGDVMVLQVSGNLMVDEHGDLRDEVRKLLDEGHVDILLSLRHTKWINSQGVGSIVAAYSSLKKNAGRFKVCSVPDRVWSVFVISRLNEILEVYDTEAEALKSFKNG